MNMASCMPGKCCIPELQPLLQGIGFELFRMLQKYIGESLAGSLVLPFCHSLDYLNFVDNLNCFGGGYFVVLSARVSCSPG